MNKKQKKLLLQEQRLDKINQKLEWDNLVAKTKQWLKDEEATGFYGEITNTNDKRKHNRTSKD